MVGVAVGGGRDQEDQVRVAVVGTEVHGWVESGEAQRSRRDVLGAAVRDRDAPRQSRGGLAFTIQDVCDEAVDVGGSAGSREALDESPDDGVLVVTEVRVERDQVGGDEGLHVVLFWWVVRLARVVLRGWVRDRRWGVPPWVGG